MPTPSSLLNAIRTFTASGRAFQVLHTIGSQTTPKLQTLYILDSSFNPPTLAHLRICCSAILKDAPKALGNARLLLLLATQNADKPSKPAGFEHRIAMMCSLAKDIRSRVIEEKGGIEGEKEDVAVDVGVVKTPLFVDKVEAIAESRVYSDDRTKGGLQQVHLIGFDTLLRLLEPRYYPDKTLGALKALFGKHRVRVTRRTDEGWGDQEEQNRFVQGLTQGSKDNQGFDRVWANNIQLIEGRQTDEEVVSSTKVRETVKQGSEAALEKLITPGVQEWIVKEKLYQADQ